MEARARIALLIDADNSSAKKLDVILSELSKYGETSIRRAYGNWTKASLRPWTEVLHPNAILPMLQFDYSRGKNASDMAMVVDAMALLYTDHPDAFGIVSSDADFTPLVMHLRAKGAQVYGFGDTKTPEAFQSACTKFLLLDQMTEQDEDGSNGDATEPSPTTGKGKAKAAVEAPLKGAAPAAGRSTAASSKSSTKKAAAVPARKSMAELKGDAKLVRLMRNAVEAAADDEGWASVSTVGNRIANQSSFDSRNLGYASLSKLLKAIDLFEFSGEGTSNFAVRDRRRAKG
ncbi:NYN domain-containing protein [Phycicoccus sp. Soil748]|uniref:NYN domain-containing protein n=1 Tax=Intrasporangiaceae TaxID=85021 RepID=UPI0007034DFF|nr:NYN domain-containing protein [Phycicoccus sp. Soil748]KRE58926.1 hypothetical protein ASG70_16955 [Phycicoccus sp. Soil748]